MERKGIKKLPAVEGTVTMTDPAQHLPAEVQQATETLQRSDDSFERPTVYLSSLR